jgi:site-specific recombinase XerD
VSLRNGVDLETLRRRLGHRNITTTQKYLHALAAEKGRKVGAPL